MEIKQISNGLFSIKNNKLRLLIKTYPFQIYEFQKGSDLTQLVRKLGSTQKIVTPVDQPNYFSIEFIFSTACNLACTYCYAREKNTGCYGLTSTNMDAVIIKKTIDFAIYKLIKQMKKNNNNNGLLDLYFMGGEPLINKQNLKYALEYVHKRINMLKNKENLSITIQPAISTNGVLIDDDIAKFFKRYKFTYVGITIDGPNHDKFRKFPNGSGTLEQVIRGIKKLIQYKVNLKIVNVVSPGDVGKIDINLKFFNDLKILSKACRISVIPRAPGINELYRACPIPQLTVSKLIEGSQHSKFTTKEKKTFSDKILEISKRYNIDERDLKRKLYELIYSGGSLYHCPAAIWKISVAPDGSVYPCHQLVNMKLFYMGNLLETKQLDKTDNYRNVKNIFKTRTVDKINKCKHCLFQTICPPLVDCPARSYLEEKSIYKTPQYCEIYYPYMESIFNEFLYKQIRS